MSKKIKKPTSKRAMLVVQDEDGEWLPVTEPSYIPGWDDTFSTLKRKYNEECVAGRSARGLEPETWDGFLYWVLANSESKATEQEDHEQFAKMVRGPGKQAKGTAKPKPRRKAKRS